MKTITLNFDIKWEYVEKRHMWEARLGGYMIGRVQEHIHRDAWVCSFEEYRNGKDYYPGDDESIEDFYESEDDAKESVYFTWLGKFIVMGGQVAKETAEVSA